MAVNATEFANAIRQQAGNQQPVSNFADAIRGRAGELPATAPEVKSQWREKIGQMTLTGAKNWAENMMVWRKFQSKDDIVWWAGAATGGLETALLFSYLGPLSGPAKVGINFAIAQGFYGISRLTHKSSESLTPGHGKALARFFAGVAFTGTLTSFGGTIGSAIEQTTGASFDVVKVIENFRGGEQAANAAAKTGGAVSQGVTGGEAKPSAQPTGVSSKPAVVVEASPTATARPTLVPSPVPTEAPPPSPTPTIIPATATSVAPTEIPRSPTIAPVPTVPEATATTIPHAPAPVPVLALAPAPGISSPDAAQLAHAAQNEIEKKFQEGVSGAVESKLGKIHELTDQVLRNSGVDPAQLLNDKPLEYEQVRLALLDHFERAANDSFGIDLEQTLHNPDDLARALKLGNTDFDYNLNHLDPTTLASGDNVIKKAVELVGGKVSGIVTESPPVPSAHTFEAIHAAVESHLLPGIPADSIVEIPSIPSSTTLGHMMVQNGYDLTNWNTPQNIDALAVQGIVNHDTLVDFWAEAQKAGNIPMNEPYPIPNLSDWQSVINGVKIGDPDAVKKLRLALMWIPSGKKFIIIKQAGLEAILKQLT